MAVKMDTTRMHSIVFENKVCATTESYALDLSSFSQVHTLVLSVFFSSLILISLRKNGSGPCHIGCNCCIFVFPSNCMVNFVSESVINLLCIQ